MGDTEHNYGYDRHLPNIYVENIFINDEEINNSDYLYIILNDEEHTTNENNGILEEVYNLPQEITIKKYKTAKGLTKIKFLYNEISAPIKYTIDEIELNTEGEKILKTKKEFNKGKLQEALLSVGIETNILGEKNFPNIATGETIKTNNRQ